VSYLFLGLGFRVEGRGLRVADLLLRGDFRVISFLGCSLLVAGLGHCVKGLGIRVYSGLKCSRMSQGLVCKAYGCWRGPPRACDATLRGSTAAAPVSERAQNQQGNEQGARYSERVCLETVDKYAADMEEIWLDRIVTWGAS
jgi:hypothetical protein